MIHLRRTLLLPLDDLVAVTREFLCPSASRSGVDRCLRRHGVGNLHALKPVTPKEPHKAFKAYEPGYLHMDVKYLPKMADETKQQCLGIPFISTDARVIDPLTLEEMPQGEQGEIIMSGPQNFSGYWKQPEATVAAFIELDGKRFFRSGDLGHVDEEGYFFITDRLKRMINASGFKVWPAEVESLMFKHPAIQEACIISTRDAYRGESVKAIVVLHAAFRGQTSENDIIDWCKGHMAAYKYPRVVEFVEMLPKSGSGKVMWRLLQKADGKPA